ncbi:MAG TPA: hypothetical protein VG222_06720 [Vicinamibacterales bacterium]|jgi:hypothetical protein|nr:hypothetical protein [Vicinamibacterales bacterium]
MEAITPQLARTRIQIEFVEMPDMKLSKAQIRRLCDLPPEVCDAALTSLVQSGFLWLRVDGSFLRRGLGRHVDGLFGPRSLSVAD